jgi:ribosome recycling factor
MQYNFTALRNDLKKIEEFLGKEYRELNVGRASPSILDSVSVESYGSRVPLKNVASIAIEDPKTLRVAPWDKNQVKDVEKAIVGANLGLSVATDESGIRVIFPQLTTENRATLVKTLKQKLEDSRIAVRGAREKILKDIESQEKAGKMTEDDRFRGKTELDKIVGETNKALESVFERKEKEVMG